MKHVERQPHRFWPALLVLATAAACGGRFERNATDLVGPSDDGGASAHSGASGSGAVSDDGGAAANGGARAAGGTAGDGAAAGLAAAGSANAGTGNSEVGSGGAAAGVQRSCVALPATCGPRGDDSCCSFSRVPHGSYDIPVNGQRFLATVSDFMLDRYEITVGRFRNFVAAYSPDLIAASAGKNPNNPADPGWDPRWNAMLPPDAAALTAALECGAGEQTWTDSPGAASTENLPINCLSWFEAEAFCIWDGGRLPTGAEWTYVSSAGSEQRLYAWGAAAADCSFANYLGLAGGMDFCVKPGGVGSTNLVGSESPKGDSKWGQADMGGNVAEWTQDYSQLIQNPCTNCANLQPNPSHYRLVKGGSFEDQEDVLRSQFRRPGVESVHLFGARCARTAPPTKAK